MSGLWRWCACVVALLVAMSAGAVVARPVTISLDGAWEASETGSADTFAGAVPGCVHTDLMAAGRLVNPFEGDNELKVQWVSDKTWTYRRTFEVSDEFISHPHVLLRCEGLDTLASVWVNGQAVGTANNMFRTWEFDVRPVLHGGENRIEIRFDSVLPYIARKEAERHLPTWEFPGSGYVRKEPCNFGWDWGPKLITAGIWRHIGLVAYDDGRISDVRIAQDHSTRGRVGLTVDVDASANGAAHLSADVEVRFAGEVVGHATGTVENGHASVQIGIGQAKLWWPVGMGEQNLYSVRTRLMDGRGAVVDEAQRRIGLRTLELLAKTDTQPLRLQVNGVPFFAKGANWIPADAFANRVTSEGLRGAVRSAVDANMNTLRFWGGGYYEEDALFDACDEMGIVVWLDFKFACMTYPVFDPAFCENVKAEVDDNVRRLRHHPCIAVWCGNNECNGLVGETWTARKMARVDYDAFYGGLIGGEVKRLAPQANYVPGSPEVGDAHDWRVWHGNAPYVAYTLLHGFVTEFGMQSFPEPRTVEAYTSAADRESVTTDVMKLHQKNGGGKGNEKIVTYIDRYFNHPKDFDSTLWVSQMSQAYAVKIGAEHWRRDWPNSTACVFWQYNDCWPVASWASVDYFGRWKALQYAAKRFYAPLLVSGVADREAGTAQIFVTNGTRDAAQGTVSWLLCDVEGNKIDGGEVDGASEAESTKRVADLKLAKAIGRVGPENVLLYMTLWMGGEEGRRAVSENLLTFAEPKDIPLKDPQIEVREMKAGPARARVVLTVKRPAMWAWVEVKGTDAKCSDNFVNLAPGVSKEIDIDAAGAAEGLGERLRVRSLFDTYDAKAVAATRLTGE